jgi:hypothetical protein
VSIVNAFPDRLPNLARHANGCVDLPDGYLTLSNRPEIPQGILDEGGVLLIAGGYRSGKSMLTHWMVHELCPRRRVVDLFSLPGDLLNLANDEARIIILTELVEQLGKGSRPPLHEGQIEEIFDKLGALDKPDKRNLQWGKLHQKLGDELQGQSLVVRLPRLDPSLEPSRALSSIVDDIKRYTEAADCANKSIYLYEYCYSQDFDSQQLRKRLGETDFYGRYDLVELGRLSPDDGWMYTKKRIEQSEQTMNSYRISKEAYTELLSGADYDSAAPMPFRLEYFNFIGHTASDRAIKLGKPMVDIDDFRNAAIRAALEPGGAR